MNIFKRMFKSCFLCCLDCAECTYNNTDKIIKKMKNDPLLK